MSKIHNPLVLGKENIGKLLWQYSIPSIIAMVATSLYHIIDSIFIGHGVGAMAISGLAITFPIMNLAAAFGSLVGVGGSAMMSMRLGAKDNRSAEEILGNVFILNVISGVIFAVIFLIFLDPFLIFFGASEATLPHARDFMKILLYGNVITHLYFGLNGLIRASGYPRKAMVNVLVSVLVNCVLAPIFIFVFNWGIAGAAWATLIAQIVAFILELFHFSNKNNFIYFKKGIFVLKKNHVKDILSIGIAPFSLNACASLIVILFNRSLLEYGGDLAIGAYGIINRLATFFTMVVLGLSQGMQPIVGYNFGAKQYDRVVKALKYTLLSAIVITTIGFLLCELFPVFMVSLFTTDAELIAISERGLRITLCLFPIIGFQMIISQFFQSIGKAKEAIFLSLSRQMLFLVPFLLILPHFYDLDGIWMSLPFSDLLSTFVAIILIVRQLNKFKKNTIS